MDEVSDKVLEEVAPFGQEVVGGARIGELPEDLDSSGESADGQPVRTVDIVEGG